MKRILGTSLVWLVVMAVSVVACAPAAQPPRAQPTQGPTEPPTGTSQAAKLVFLGNKNIPPVVYLDGTAPAGVAVDIVRELAKYIPQPIEINAMDWSEAQALVAQGQADALIQINPTDERQKIYDFSDPLLESHFSIFTTTDRMGLSDIASLGGLRVGVEAAGLPRQLLGNDPTIALTIIPDFLTGFAQLTAGSIDAVVVDYRVGSYVIAENNLRNIKVAGDPIAPSYSAFAVKKGNIQLLNEINKALRLIKADGTYQAVLDKWTPTEVVFQTQAQITERIYLTTILFLLLLVLIAVIGLVTIRRELARRKATEARLRDHYSTLQGIINGANAPIFSVDRQYRYTSFNAGHADTMKALYGADIEPGRSLLEYIVVPEDREAARRNLDRAFTGECLVEEAYSGQDLQSRRFFQVSHNPIRTDDGIIGVAVLAQDLTERKQAEDEIRRLNEDLQQALRQEQAMHQQLAQAERLGALGRMVSSVAHELNNPLQTIRNCLYLTGADLPPESPIHQYLAMASSETQRLVSLVAQLRELYRPRTVAPETHDLVPLLGNVRALMTAQLESGQVQWQQPAELPPYPVRMVPDRLKQVFINVANNAIEAMQPAGGQLEVNATLSADGTQVGVGFKDCGPGIPAENLDRLFEPFFTTKSQGLGLGLPICYEIAQQHGGRITVESQPGQGAVFTLWLPLAQAAEGGPGQQPPGDQPDASL